MPGGVILLSCGPLPVMIWSCGMLMLRYTASLQFKEDVIWLK